MTALIESGDPGENPGHARSLKTSMMVGRIPVRSPKPARVKVTSMASVTAVRQISNEQAPPAPEIDPVKSARSAGLRYICDDTPGLQRQRAGRGFSYRDVNGDRITAPDVLKRIRSLVIPPAWRDVWICPDPNGHLQATGRDAKGRKQYRYHAKWQLIRNQAKFDRMIAFGQALPSIRRDTDRHLRQRNLSREKVLATVVRLLEETLIRIGNDEYAQKNKSFGLTTLRNRHVEISTTTVWFRFKGKSGVQHEIQLRDRRLTRIIQQCQELPGYELFQYVDEAGQRQSVDSADVNAYLQDMTGEAFTAKDFRTWAGTAETLRILYSLPPPSTKTETQKNIRETIKAVAKKLGNRVATCRKYYVHPILLQGYEEGWLLPLLDKEFGKLDLDLNTPVDDLDLQPEEQALLALLMDERARLNSPSP